MDTLGTTSQFRKRTKQTKKKKIHLRLASSSQRMTSNAIVANQPQTSKPK